MRAAAIGLTSVCALVFTAAVARADGDPASDVLLAQDYYLPYVAKPSGAYTRALTRVLRASHAARYPLKVAVIASAEDLGTVPQLLGKPQDYADFLASEISFQAKGPLLVVMPGGYGTHNAGGHADRALSGLQAPGSSGDAMTKAAVDASLRLAKAAGHPLPKPELPGNSSGSGSSALVIAAVLVGLIGLAGALLALKRSRQGVDEAA